MKESTGIEKEISTLHKRREALAVDVRSASRDLEAAREGLVTGPADVAHVTGAQSTFTALDEALAGVDARLTRLRERMEAALVLEQKQAGNTRLREIQEARARVAEKVRLLRSTGDAQLRELASKVLGAMDEWQALGKEGKAILGRVYGEGKAGHTLLLHPATKDFPQLPPLEFGPAVDHAVAIKVAEIDRQHRKALTRETAERQRERERRQLTNNHAPHAA